MKKDDKLRFYGMMDKLKGDVYKQLKKFMEEKFVEFVKTDNRLARLEHTKAVDAWTHFIAGAFLLVVIAPYDFWAKLFLLQHSQGAGWMNIVAFVLGLYGIVKGISGWRK